ncbi:MAG: F0F1 ATP synthase subunit A [Candidatus Methylacidiphilales bacterium]|nr:F0F1 ATP synthase subunit A [Candidatus Methylacidiphilales bacterium]
MTNLALDILAAGLPKNPAPIFDNGTVVFTNSMVATWIGAAVVILFARIAMRNPQLVPSGAQNFAEWIVEGLAQMLAGILGWDLMRKTFWFFGTVFIFIMSVNLLALIPGVGSIGWNEAGHAAHGGGSHEHIAYPLLRGVNADLNMTAAMSLTFFVFWFIWAFTSIGPVGFFTHLFGSRMPGLIGWLLFPVFIIVGMIECVSIIFRPVSLSFRLYGNIFGGENLLEAMYMVCVQKGVTFLAPFLLVPFYFFELIVAFVQALVFCLLTAAFTATMCSHADHDDHGHGDDHAHDVPGEGHTAAKAGH